MTSVFSRIVAGELPGRFVHEDEAVVAFLSIAPIRPGHTLVVPRREVDGWTAVDGDLLGRCTAVAQRIGAAAMRAWDAPRAVLLVAGFEVPHLHLHVLPAWGLEDVDPARADRHATERELDEAAHRLRAALAEG